MPLIRPDGWPRLPQTSAWNQQLPHSSASPPKVKTVYGLEHLRKNFTITKEIIEMD